MLLGMSGYAYMSICARVYTIIWWIEQQYMNQNRIKKCVIAN